MSFPYSVFSRIIPHSLSVCNRLLFPPSFVCPLAGLPTVRFGFFSALCSLIEAKKYPVGFPTRHQRRSSQQIRQAAFSFGDICCSAILFYGFHQELWVTEILLHKIIRLHIMHPKICFTKFAWFFSRTRDILPPLSSRLKWGLLVRLPRWAKHSRAIPVCPTVLFG